MKPRKKMSLLVIAPWGPDIGFRLGGAPVKTLSDRETLNMEIENVFREKEVGILAIPEGMKEWITEHNKKRIEQATFPMVIYYPFPEEWEAPLETEREMEEIVHRAIGYRLRIRL